MLCGEVGRVQGLESKRVKFDSSLPQFPSLESVVCMSLCTTLWKADYLKWLFMEDRKSQLSSIEKASGGEHVVHPSVLRSKPELSEIP